VSVPKARISVDGRNRLVVTRTFRGRRHEADVEGRGKAFRVGRVAVDGRWSLTPEHDLKFSAAGRDRAGLGKTVILRGEIIKAGGAGLLFRVRRSESAAGISARTVELKGTWRADAANRITFRASRSGGRYDMLRFEGVWDINKRNELVYRYAGTALRRGKKEERTIVFRGRWDLTRSRIVYSLERSSGSVFEFKAALQSPSLRASDGEIKYQVGIRYRKDRVYRRVRKVVVLYGAWKLGRGLSVRFEMPCSGGRAAALVFEAGKLEGDHGKVIVSLRRVGGKRMDLEVEFRKAFASDAELFLMIGSSAAGGSRKDLSILGGLRVRF